MNRDRSGRIRRRSFLLGAGTLAAGVAGCTDLLGDDPIRFEADAAVVDEQALDGTGYDEHRRYRDTVSRTFEAAGQQKDVEVENHIAEYDRAVEIAGDRYQGAVFAVLSTPRVEVLDQSFNPVDDMDNREIAMEVQERYDEIENLERRDEYSIEITGDETRIVRYDADARLADGAGVSVDLVLHVSDPVEAADSFLVCVGGYPTLFDDDDAVRALMRGVTIAE